MSKAITPRKTEYKRTIFKSKADAQLARYFDVASLPTKYGEFIQHRWWYEPEFLRVGDYVPDFLIQATEVNRWDDRFYLENIRYSVIEVKPSGTTETYKNELAERYLQIKQLEFCKVMETSIAPCYFSYELWEGSVYSGNFKIWKFVGYGDHIPDCIKVPFDDSLEGPLEIDAKIAQSIKSYRFDLAEACNDV